MNISTSKRLFAGQILSSLVLIWIAFFITASVYTPGEALAQGKVKPEWRDMPDYYPDGFDGWGKIDRISDTEIVVDDRLLSFASFVKFSTPVIRDASIASFNKGEEVGYILNSDKKLTSLWLIKINQ